VTDDQASAASQASNSLTKSRTGRVVLDVAGLILLVAVSHFAFSFLRPSVRPDRSFEAIGAVPSITPGVLTKSLRREASFEGHAYVYAEDPENPGKYAVVFTPALAGGDDLAYDAIRHAILTAYGRDLSGVQPAVSPQGTALRVEFSADGIAYVAIATWDAAHRELIAFSLHREE
jgi:hypothetical protein